MATRSTKNGTTQNRPRATRPGKASDTVDRPAESMAGAVAETSAGMAAPTRVAPEQTTSVAELPMVSTMPLLVPPDLRDPDSVTDAAVETVTGTVRGNQYIDALWSIDQVRNAFALVRGLGWRKLYNGRDGAFMALTALASQARQTGSPITFREEADGMIYEIYLW